MHWLEQIKKYTPYNEQEAQDKEVILQCIEAFDDVLTRNNRLAHITSSAFVVNQTKDKVLMVHHNIYNSWSWTGGHADGAEDLLAVALRELAEETGVKNARPLTNDIFSLDIIPVIGHFKKGQYVSAHVHLSVAYLVEADDSQPLVVKDDENSGVKWVPVEEVCHYSNEPHMQKLYRKLIFKIKNSCF
ncbi:MAG: NUDIX hydrolase [Clostridia bacterium]|nr:NUDIX hydrolase [Clostridia bacterium]